MKKFLKKTEGFTLVELIVVIAILGILAAVAVPAYSGYLTKAKEASDVTTLDAVFSAEYLETIQERIVYIKNYEGAEVPFAIDLTDTAFAKACHLEKFGLYIAFPGNTGRNDQLDEFVDYLLNWK